jgi:glycogen debranching enzyme
MRKVIVVLGLFISAHVSAQEISSDNSAVNEAFGLAVKTVDINIRRGILAAGGDYGGEWTRDISINSWNGVSLLRPEVAERSLWSVTVNKDTIGQQYWDKIIWVIAAYNHYKATGDRVFLKQAYQCSAATIKALEKQTYDAKYGLFKGPSVFNDGIAGYPEPIYEPANHSSSVLDHKGSANIKCLSTNCIYYGAYVALAKMSLLVKDDQKTTGDFQQKAARLKANILQYFYDKDNNNFLYLIDQNGKPFNAQEGLGISFAVIFGIIDGDKADELVGRAVVSKYGITSIYPDFPRNTVQKPGRHNNIVWPMVNGFFAEAAVTAGNYSSFTNELFNLTHLAIDQNKGDYNFREIYNPYSGKPDGGWQANGPAHPDFHWESCKLQTWSATAYISMVLNGLVGMRLNDASMSFQPFLPAGISHLSLNNIRYRNSVLDMAISGHGKSVKTFAVDGKKQAHYFIASGLTGKHRVTITLE